MVPYASAAMACAPPIRKNSRTPRNVRSPDFQSRRGETTRISGNARDLRRNHGHQHRGRQRIAATGNIASSRLQRPHHSGLPEFPAQRYCAMAVVLPFAILPNVCCRNLQGLLETIGYRSMPSPVRHRQRGEAAGILSRPTFPRTGARSGHRFFTSVTIRPTFFSTRARSVAPRCSSAQTKASALRPRSVRITAPIVQWILHNSFGLGSREFRHDLPRCGFPIIVFTATHSPSLKVEIVGFCNAGSTAKTAARSPCGR